MQHRQVRNNNDTTVAARVLYIYTLRYLQSLYKLHGSSIGRRRGSAKWGGCDNDNVRSALAGGSTAATLMDALIIGHPIYLRRNTQLLSCLLYVFLLHEKLYYNIIANECARANKKSLQ